MLANFNAGGYRITNVAAPVASTDVVRLADISNTSGNTVVNSDILSSSAVNGPGNGNVANLTSVNLTAGTWILFGQICTNSSNCPSFLQAQITLTSAAFAALETGGTNGAYGVGGSSNVLYLPVGGSTFVLASPATLYLVYSPYYAGSSSGSKFYGSLTAVPVP